MITTRDIPKYCSKKPTYWLEKDDDHRSYTREHPYCGPQETVRFKFHWAHTPSKETGSIAFEVRTASYPNTDDDFDAEYTRAMDAHADLMRVLASYGITGAYEWQRDDRSVTTMLDFTELLPVDLVQTWVAELGQAVYLPGGMPAGMKDTAAREFHLKKEAREKGIINDTK